MKNTRFILGIGLLALIGSCKKPDTTSTPVSVFSTYSSINEVFDKLRLQPKYVTVNAVTGGSFFGNSGTRYVIPPNCLQDGTGNAVTTNVQFEVAEYLKKGDMIFSKMLPVSDGQPLISGGEISIKATLSGLPVYLKPGGCVCTAYIPQATIPQSGMSYFSGIPNQDTSASIVNWRRFDSVSGRTIIYIKDTTKTKKDSLAIITDSLKFINCDKYWDQSNFQKFNIQISITGNTMSSTSDIRSFIFVDTFASLLHLGKSISGRIDNISFEKTPVHFVVFGLIDKKFYGGVYAATPATGSTYNVTLTEVKPEDFKAQLNNLTK